MPDFLSPDWIAALDARLAAAGGSSEMPLTVEFVVDTGEGEGEVAYHLTLGPDGESAVAGRAAAPDVTFHMDGATAAAIAAGNLSAEEAFLTGRLDLDGDAGRLIDAHRAAGGA